jgi:diguanylate cyclase (GGDEF)-like protein
MSVNNLPVLAVICDRFGRVQQVLRDDTGVTADLEPNDPFHTLISEGSSKKALRFLDTLEEKGAASNWEFVVKVDGKLKTFHFTGGRQGEQQLIVGSSTPGDLEFQFQEMMRICSQQANQIRQQAKKQAEAERQQDQQGEVIDDLSRLNNELVSIQRELAKKNHELENLYQNEQRRTRELNALYHAASSLLTSLEIEPLLDDIMAAAFEALPKAFRGLLLLEDDSENNFSIEASRGWDQVPELEPLLSTLEQKIKQANQERRPLLVSEPHLLLDQDSADPAKEEGSELIIPLLTDQASLGVLILYSSDPEYLEKADLRLWQAFGATATAAIQNASLHERIQQLAITDPLTEINNRRGFTLLAQQQFKHARRYHQPLCILMVDLDHFKQVNDQHGHPVGDQVLVEITRRLAEELREADLIGRYGGEEFVILLSNSNQEEGMIIAERLLEIVRGQAISTDAGEIQITISIGLACEESSPKLDALVEEADQALYRAKQAGRDQVQTHPEP